MSIKTKKTIYLVYSILLSVLLIVSGILLMVSCYNIYRLGESPFTYDSISAAFSKIQVFIIITVCAVLIGMIFKFFFPEEKVKIKAKADCQAILAKLEKKLDREACDEKTLRAIKKEQTLRIILSITAIVLSEVSLIPALLFILNNENFSTADTTASVLSLVTLILPFLLISSGLAIALSYIEDASYKRQTEQVKAALAYAKISGDIPCSSCKKDKVKRTVVICARIVVAVIVVTFIILGIANGGMAAVLEKATVICQECIGIG